MYNIFNTVNYDRILMEGLLILAKIIFILIGFFKNFFEEAYGYLYTQLNNNREN